MRVTRRVVEGEHCTVRLVECRDDRAHWSPAELATATQLVLVRSGRFRLRADGRRMTIDPTCGYLQSPGHEAQFSHPAGGDVCTSITLPRELVPESIEARTDPVVRVDARLELAHRLLLRPHDDPDDAATDVALQLLTLASRKEPGDIPAPGRHALADLARDAILAGEPASANLVALARQLATSPSHLSRTFRHHTGMSISRYRNRVRVSRALQRLDDGERDLARLAAGLGFSDQAHLTRTMRRELGFTPRQVRDQLTEG